MKTEELKLWIIERILRTEDEKLLLSTMHLLDGPDIPIEEIPAKQLREPITRYNSPTMTETFKVSEAELAAIEEARAQFVRGEVLTAEEAERDIQAWIRD